MTWLNLYFKFYSRKFAINIRIQYGYRKFYVILPFLEINVFHLTDFYDNEIGSNCEKALNMGRNVNETLTFFTATASNKEEIIV